MVHFLFAKKTNKKKLWPSGDRGELVKETFHGSRDRIHIPR